MYVLMMTYQKEICILHFWLDYLIWENSSYSCDVCWSLNSLRCILLTKLHRPGRAHWGAAHRIQQHGGHDVLDTKKIY